MIFFFLGNGYITTEVLREILKELDDKITSEDLDLMIQEIDSDGSGTVDFDGMSNNINICTYVRRTYIQTYNISISYVRVHYV